jgi:hypothetical protein
MDSTDATAVHHSEAATIGEASMPPGRDTAASKATAAAVVRAVGVVAGPTALFDLFLAGSMVATTCGALTRPRSRLTRRLRPLVAVGTALACAYPVVIRPWMRHWGATEEERDKALPGDELVPHPITTSTRAITVDAPVEVVWPWLAQIGQDRGGFYSYEWLENLAGCRMRNADRVHPEWQRREAGEVVKLHPATGCTVVAFEPNHALVLAGWGAFVVQPLDARRTRVILRSRAPRGWSAVYGMLLIELPHFIMERKMLLGIKARAERAWESRKPY